MPKITTAKEYNEAIEQVESLLDDFDNNKAQIDALADAIEEWESKDPEIIAYLKEVDALDPHASSIRFLMDQHGLEAKDFADEIGSEADVLAVVEEKAKLTDEQVNKLAKRFGLETTFFTK